MPDRSTLARLALIAACLAAPLMAQQLPLAVDPVWSELGAPVTFQVSGDKPSYTLDIEDCPELSAQCIVLTTNGATVYLTYSLDAAALRGQRIRFSANMLVDYPRISFAQLFIRVDRVAGVGFHEYTKSRPDDPRGWATPELIGTVDDDAKSISIGLRFSGRGTVFLADPKLEKARE
jgi:hypothetical protein